MKKIALLICLFGISLTTISIFALPNITTATTFYPVNWSIEQLPFEATDAGDIALSSGQIHIAYSVYGKNISIAKLAEDQWVSETVPTGGHSFLQASNPTMAINPVNGDFHLSYVHCNPWSCNGMYSVKKEADWLTERVGLAGDILLDSNGTPHIFGTKPPNVNANTTLYHAYLTAAGWQEEIIATNATTSGFSFAIDELDQLHFAYTVFQTNILWYGNEQDGEPITDQGHDRPGDFIPGEISITAKEGLPTISFIDFGETTSAYPVDHDIVNEKLRYVQLSKSGTWDFTTVASNNVGQGNQISLDAFGIPHLVYFDAENMTFNYFTWEDGVKRYEVIAQANQFDEIDFYLDRELQPHIAFYGSPVGQNNAERGLHYIFGESTGRLSNRLPLRHYIPLVSK